MANVGGPHNNQQQPGLQAFQNAAGGAHNNTQIKVNRNTGNVGTVSLFGRAWRAVTPENFDRRENNRSNIESFRMALLNRNNNVPAISAALDRFLPGHQNGNVPLTAGAVRHSIEYVNISNMTVANAVDQPGFRAVIDHQRATENLDFYLEARDILGDGNNIIDAQRFNAAFHRFIPEGVREQINIAGELRQRITQFVGNNNVQNYNPNQSGEARQLLREAQRSVENMMTGAPLERFKDALVRLIDQQ